MIRLSQMYLFVSIQETEVISNFM